MFVMVREYAEPRSVEEVMRRVREGLVPMLRRQPGFRAYHAFAEAGDRGGAAAAAISVTVFADRDGLMAANDRVRAWVSATLRELLPHPPEVVAGRVLDEELAPQAAAAAASPPHLAIWHFHDAAPAAEVAPLARLHLAPMLRQERRLRGLYGFRTMADPRRAVKVALFDDAMAAAEVYRGLRAAMLAHLPGAFPSEARVTAGTAAVCELATASG